jgi:probable rRNA maturation factor
MSGITLRNHQRRWKIQLSFLRGILEVVLEDALFAPPPPIEPDHELAFQFISSAAMARLNWKHLQHEGDTDVITFDYGIGQAGAGQGAALHGEIFICPEVAERQAREFQTEWQAELVRYAIHGLLHLRGFDDLDPAQRRRMKREENRLLKDVATRFPLRDVGSGPTVSP